MVTPSHFVYHSLLYRIFPWNRCLPNDAASDHTPNLPTPCCTTPRHSASSRTPLYNGLITLPHFREALSRGGTYFRTSRRAVERSAQEFRNDCNRTTALSTATLRNVPLRISFFSFCLFFVDLLLAKAIGNAETLDSPCCKTLRELFPIGIRTTSRKCGRNFRHVNVSFPERLV